MEKLYILCIDDQRDVMRNVSRDLLPFADWTVIEECESAAEAAKLSEELLADGKRLALIFCDHIMPGMTGVDFMISLEQSGRFPHMKKVLITGQATHNDAMSAVNEAKIDGYVAKPWKREHLQQFCRRLLTEYVFDAGLDIAAYRPHLDPHVLLRRGEEGAWAASE